MDLTPSTFNDANTGAAAGLPTLPPRRPLLVPERSDFLDGDAPAAGIDPDRLGACGIHNSHKTAINDAIRNGASMHEVREFAGHSDIRKTEVYFVRREEDAEVAARRI